MTTQTIAGAGTVAPAEPVQRRRGQGREALLFLAPFLILYLLFVIGPLIYALIMSFFDSSLVQPGLGSFAGIGNYVEALTSDAFWSSLWHTICFTHPHHATAGGFGVRARPARRPRGARTMVLPVRLLRPVRAAVGRHGADLDLDLHTCDRSRERLADQHRDHAAELAR